MVLPQCNTQRHNVEMVVDDVVVINPAHQPDTLAAFDEAYSTTMERIGLKTKPADPTGFKAFRELTRGEVLGFIIDTETLSWNFGLEKRDKIILALEATYNKHDINRPVLINLKTAQRAYGKLNAITACWTHIKAWLIFISRDIGQYIIRNPGANDAPARQQKLNFQFSHQARRDLHFLRAVIVTMETAWIPLSNPEPHTPSMFDINIYTDASGQTDLQPGDKPPALGVIIPPHSGVEARAVSFPVPMDFLLAEDDVTKNHHNSMFLEGLAITTAIVKWPETFRNKTVLATTDSLSLLYIYNSGRPKGVYMGHLIRALYIITDWLKCDLHLKWNKRRNTEYDQMADDLTHQNFSSVTPDFTNQAVEELPEPILATLTQSVNFDTHVFSDLWIRIISHWQNTK